MRLNSKNPGKSLGFFRRLNRERTVFVQIIAKIHTDFPEKFGIPRQSGLAENEGVIVFEAAFRSADAVRGLEEFDYIWLLWQFQGVERGRWSPTVRPPRKGGNERMGVFATRSPFRPNSIGLSSVRLKKIELGEQGPVLYVQGADLRDGTPIYDIKPYLPYTDSHPSARCGFAAQGLSHVLSVQFPDPLLALVPPEKRHALIQVLRQDPRPAYQDDPMREYGVLFAGLNVKFTVQDIQLTVTAVEKTDC